MKLKEQIGKDYYFENEANEIIHITADSLEQAERVFGELLAYEETKPSPMEILKSRLVRKAKSSAKEFLDKTDYLVIRHLEQRELRVATTLTEAEYTALLTKRNQARIDSNNEEASIESKTTITDLEKIKIASKG